MGNDSPADAQKGLLPLAESLFAPEVFASEATSFASGSGIVSITFTSFRWDNSDAANPVQKRVVVGRLIMPVGGAQGLAAGLYDYLAKNGLDPVPRPTTLEQIQ